MGGLNRRIFFSLTALEAGNPRSRSCRDLFLVRLYSWFLGSTFSIYAHMVDRKVSGLLIKAVIPSLRAHPHDRRRRWHPTPVLLPGKSHGWRSLVGCSPWGRQESDTTERLHFHFSLSCTGEGNGNPLQYSCLENPRDGGAWWTAVYGIAQSWTRLKWLSSSSSWPHQMLISPLRSCLQIPSLWRSDFNI